MFRLTMCRADCCDSKGLILINVSFGSHIHFLGFGLRIIFRIQQKNTTNSIDNDNEYMKWHISRVLSICSVQEVNEIRNKGLIRDLPKRHQ